jgi:putative ABC transport system permease protein
MNHDDQPFRVAGILAPTGTPVDRTVHVSLPGIEAGASRTGAVRCGRSAANASEADTLRE